MRETYHKDHLLDIISEIEVEFMLLTLAVAGDCGVED